MTRLVEHPTDQQIYDSEYRHAGRQGYKRAYLKQQRLAKWQSRNDENTVVVDSRPSGGLDASLDHAYPGSYLARALRAQQPEEPAASAPVTRIPANIDERSAQSSYETYHDRWTLSLERNEALVRFGIALNLAIPGEKRLDQTRTDLILRLINSAEAANRFS